MGYLSISQTCYFLQHHQSSQGHVGRSWAETWHPPSPQPCLPRESQDCPFLLNYYLGIRGSVMC